MNDVELHTAQLPDTIDDLSRFVLVNEERVQALRAEIRAIKKVDLAKEVYEQKLAEAQEIGKVTVEAARKMGELLLQIKKSSGHYAESENRPTSKNTITSEMGITKDQVSQFQQMAMTPEAINIAVQKAIERGDVVSRSQVMKEIKALKAENERLHADNVTLAKRSEPQVIEKEVVREVVPEDYQKLKQDVTELRKKNKQLSESLDGADEYYRKCAAEITAKLHQKEQELEAITTQPDVELRHNLHKNVIFFCSAVNEFLGNCGGLAYLSDYWDQLDANERRMVEGALNRISNWTDEMLNRTVSEVVNE